MKAGAAGVASASSTLSKARQFPVRCGPLSGSTRDRLAAIIICLAMMVRPVLRSEQQRLRVSVPGWRRAGYRGAAINMIAFACKAAGRPPRSGGRQMLRALPGSTGSFDRPCKWAPTPARLNAVAFAAKNPTAAARPDRRQFGAALRDGTSRRGRPGGSSRPWSAAARVCLNALKALYQEPRCPSAVTETANPRT